MKKYEGPVLVDGYVGYNPIELQADMLAYPSEDVGLGRLQNPLCRNLKANNVA